MTYVIHGYVYIFRVPYTLLTAVSSTFAAPLLFKSRASPFATPLLRAPLLSTRLHLFLMMKIYGSYSIPNKMVHTQTSCMCARRYYYNNHSRYHGAKAPA